MTILPERRDHFKLNSDRRRQRANFNRRACGVWFVLAGKILCVKFVVDWEILFHVRKKYGDIDDVVPARARVFEHESHIFKHGVTLCFNVVTDDVASWEIGRASCRERWDVGS